MSIIKNIFLLIILVGKYTNTVGQIHFIIPPLIDGVFTSERVFQFSAANTAGGGAFQGVIEIALTKLNGEPVALYRSGPVALKPGEALSGQAMEWTRAAQFGANEEGKRLRESGALEYGDYALCYTTVGNMRTRNCTEVKSEPLTPPRLAYPEDGEAVATVNPLLSWTPPMPVFDAPFTYSMKLVALKAGQSCPQALQQNPPVAQANRQENLNYPVDARDGTGLAYDQTYCWQVGAFRQNTLIGTTEIWRFTPRKPLNKLPTAAAVSQAPYQYLKHDLDGEIARATPLLKFVFDNRLGSPTLQYTVYAGSVFDKKSVADQRFMLKEGVNYLTLDCSAFPNLLANKPYILEATDDRGAAFYCRFVYVK